MKAYITTQFGPPEVLKLQEIDKPSPKPNEILIKVEASTVNAADCNLRGHTYIPKGLGFLAKLMLGFKKPKISVQGSVFAGEVIETGSDVSLFQTGDKVFGTGPELGAYAEILCRPETGAITHLPKNITYEEAASVPYGALTALHFLRDMAKIQPGQKVLVKGASGGVGVYAVQLAKYFGAEVTGICSTPNVEFVKSLGADKVIDYTKEDYTKAGEMYDIIFDVVVNDTSFNKNKQSLKPKGKYLAVAGGLNDMLAMLKTSITGGKKVYFGGGEKSETSANMDLLASLLKEKSLKPVVGKIFSFSDMTEAHAFAESGSKRGNVIISQY